MQEFAFTLALRLGMTVAELQSRMTLEEFLWWCAYNVNNPLSLERGDVQAAVVASTIANVNRGKKTKPFKLIDFMPYHQEERQKAKVQNGLNEFLARFGSDKNGA